MTMPALPVTKKISCPECGKEFDATPRQIEREKLILAEGMDVHGFLFHAARAFDRDDIQVFNFKGKDELRLFLEDLANMENFTSVNTIVIARDAETNVQSSIQSIRSALENARNVNLPIPIRPFEFTSRNGIKIAFILFPGFDKNGNLRSGTIEDLCLATVGDDPLVKNCVSSFLVCVRENQQGNDKLRHPWKSKLHAYLAGKDDHVGKKLGVAAKDRVWKWDHAAMAPFKKIIQEM